MQPRRAVFCTLICAATVIIFTWIYHLSGRGDNLPIGGRLCVGFLGGLGNLMFEYASTYGIAREKGMVFIMAKNEKLWNIFPGLKALQIQDSGLCRKHKAHREKRACAFDEETIDFRSDERVRLEGYLQSWKYFIHVKDDIRKQFTFKPETMKRAKALLASSVRFSQNEQGVVTVGVHVRRTDKLTNQSVSIGYVVPGKDYLNRAMDYFRNNLKPRPLFVVCSDDGNWTRDNVQSRDAVTIPSNSPDVDMALLSLCDHHIITVGTFGWWAAFLSNGTTVYYGQSFRPGSWLDKNAASDPAQTHYFPPTWISIT